MAIDAREFFFYDDSDDETDDSLEHVDDEPDDCAKDLSDDEEEIGEPVPLVHTFNMKQRLANEDLASKVKEVLSFMKQKKINLPIFLDALSWGDAGCRSDPEIQYARTSLMVSEELPGILTRWYKPPRSLNHKKGKRPAGARNTLLEFAVECVSDVVDREMKCSASLFLSPPEELTEEHLTKLDFKKFKTKIIRDAPVFWGLLRRAAYSKKQELRNRHKDPDMVSTKSLSTWPRLPNYYLGNPKHGLTSTRHMVSSTWPFSQALGHLSQSLWSLCTRV
jgi:hypothetical protein